MAEYAHQVPEKYGHPAGVYHPRIHSYHRRLMAALMPSLVVIGIIFMLTRHRYALPYTLGMVVAMLLALFAIYSVLKPTIAVRTDTHLLHSRVFGWRAVKLTNIAQTVFVERLASKKSMQVKDGGANSLRFKGIPALWGVNAKGKKVIRFDGRIWDHKTLRQIAAESSPQTVVYDRINVVQMNKQHPGLVSFNELHPGWRSATITILSALALIAIAVFSLIPEETLRQWHLL
ncbi:hypothetical protein VVR12_10140 [Rothia sp. LK2588]|uniref:hypothetical protein n=1 Tax=Rothia sp. LK2588 TaxID=3114369 RepID=UPI0034CE33FD